MLILDEFKGHMTAEVRDAIKLCGTHLELIPGGYTSKLQVMDVGFNKPFKDQFRHHYDHFSRTEDTAPNRENVSTWIQDSWEALSFARIATNTWRRVGLPQPVIDPQLIDPQLVPIDENFIMAENDEDVIEAVVNDEVQEQEEEDGWMYADTDDIRGDIVTLNELGE
jgi:hypothetical protein